MTMMPIIMNTRFVKEFVTALNSAGFNNVTVEEFSGEESMICVLSEGMRIKDIYRVVKAMEINKTNSN
jgi:nitrogen regulatory protein PII